MKLGMGKSKLEANEKLKFTLCSEHDVMTHNGQKFNALIRNMKKSLESVTYICFEIPRFSTRSKIDVHNFVENTGLLLNKWTLSMSY
jgi:hypothetical protein